MNLKNLRNSLVVHVFENDREASKMVDQHIIPTVAAFMKSRKPVAWRWRHRMSDDGTWSHSTQEPVLSEELFVIEPLYL